MNARQNRKTVTTNLPEKNPYYELQELLDAHGKSLRSLCEYIVDEIPCDQWECIDREQEFERLYDSLKKSIQRNRMADASSLRPKSIRNGLEYLKYAYDLCELDGVVPQKMGPSKRIPSAVANFFSSPRTFSSLLANIDEVKSP